MVNGLLMGSFRIEDGHQKDEALIKSLKLSALPHPHNSSRKGEELEIELIINPYLKYEVQRAPVPRIVVHPNSIGIEFLALRILVDLTLCATSFDCSSVSLSYPFNKPVN